MATSLWSFHSQEVGSDRQSKHLATGVNHFAEDEQLRGRFERLKTVYTLSAHQIRRKMAKPRRPNAVPVALLLLAALLSPVFLGAPSALAKDPFVAATVALPAGGIP